MPAPLRAVCGLGSSCRRQHSSRPSSMALGGSFVISRCASFQPSSRWVLGVGAVCTCAQLKHEPGVLEAATRARRAHLHARGRVRGGACVVLRRNRGAFMPCTSRTKNSQNHRELSTSVKVREPGIGGNDRELVTSVHDRELVTSVKVREPGIGGNDRELVTSVHDRELVTGNKCQRSRTLKSAPMVVCWCMLASQLLQRALDKRDEVSALYIPDHAPRHRSQIRTFIELKARR